MDLAERKERCLLELETRLGSGGRTRFFRAPGRVDLMGSHTDYNQGLILAATVDRDIIAAARLRSTGVLNLYSLNTEVEVRLHRERIVFDPAHGWANYPKAVIRELIKLGAPLDGLDLVVHGEVPVGGNLSSSAALEAVACEAVIGLTEFYLPPWERAVLCRRAENVFVGVPCGIMDQFTVFMSRENCVLLLDCQTLQFEIIPFFADQAALLVIDSGQGRQLVASKYAERVQECRQAVKILSARRPGMTSLREASAEDLAAMKDKLGERLWRRARHVITENERVKAAAEALRRSEPAELGRIMNAGYESSRTDYENSTPALDALHELILSESGVWGARICGAGWGGCLLALVETNRAKAVIEAVGEKYETRTGLSCRSWTVTPGRGAGPLE